MFNKWLSFVSAKNFGKRQIKLKWLPHFVICLVRFFAFFYLMIPSDLQAWFMLFFCLEYSSHLLPFYLATPGHPSLQSLILLTLSATFGVLLWHAVFPYHSWSYFVGFAYLCLSCQGVSSIKSGVVNFVICIPSILHSAGYIVGFKYLNEWLSWDVMWTRDYDPISQVFYQLEELEICLTLRKFS